MVVTIIDRRSEYGNNLNDNEMYDLATRYSDAFKELHSLFTFSIDNGWIQCRIELFSFNDPRSVECFCYYRQKKGEVRHEAALDVVRKVDLPSQLMECSVGKLIHNIL